MLACRLCLIHIIRNSIFFAILSILASLARPPGNITFEIPARELYYPVTISGFKNQSILNRRQRQKRSQPIFNFTDALILITAHVLLMFTIRTVRLLDISCCLSHLVYQLTLVNIFFSFDYLFYY